MAANSAGGKLGGWLATLAEDELAELLRARPDVLLAPQPRSLAELADRLSTPYGLREALGALTETGLCLLEGIRALGAEATRERLHDLFGGPAAVPPDRLASELAALRRLGLCWPDGERLATPGMLGELLPRPLSVGRPARQLLGRLTVEQLRQIGQCYDLSGLARKDAWVTEVAAAITDPVTLRRRLAAAAPELRELVERVAWHGPMVGGVFLPGPHQRVPVNLRGPELARNGWVIPEPWGQLGEMPREVAFAVRGEDYHPTLPARPVVATGSPPDQERLLGGARGAAAAAVDGMNRLLALLGHSPLAILQSGGIGVRELRRAAKSLRCPERELRLWLESAAAAELVTVEDGAMLPTEAADAWSRAEPAKGWATLVAAWWGLPVVPTHRVDQDGKQQPVFGGHLPPLSATGLRADLLDAFAEAGTPLSDFDGVIDLLAWRRPLAFGDPETLGPYAVAARSEGRTLGLIADDAITPLGAALRAAARTDDLATALAGAISGLLPAPAVTATFLPDLTAIVSGAASADLAALLDGCADTEARDVASTWRFSPASVRRALDGGQNADTLLAELTAAADKPLPQPLTYLVHDVARRHGRLRVRAVACCVCLPDAAMATEIAAHRSLAALKLVALADTVLGSVKSVADTLAALRAAGYAPVREDAAGRTVVERAPARRAKPPRARARVPMGAVHAPSRTALGAEALAAALHRAGSVTERVIGHPAARPVPTELMDPMFNITPRAEG